MIDDIFFFSFFFFFFLIATQSSNVNYVHIMFNSFATYMNPRDIPFVHTHLAIFSFFPGMRVHTFLIYIYITNYAIDISSYIISLFLILIILLFLFSPIFSSLILIYLFLEVAAHPVLLSIVVVSLLLATSRTVFLLLRCQWLSVLSRLPSSLSFPFSSCHFTLRPCAVNVTRHPLLPLLHLRI